VARFDTVLKGGRVIDPANGVDAVGDLGIRAGRIVDCAERLEVADTDQVIDVHGKLVLPGIIDCHVHISEWLGGAAGHRMLAAAGVVTAIDHAGPVEEVLRTARSHGAGLTIGSLSAVIPGRTVADRDPSRAALDAMITAQMRAGALGVKILGGHYPLSPEGTGRVIEAANAARVYVSFHIGTTTHPDNDLHALQEALEIADGRPLHIPHVNSYCRGYVLGDPYLEIPQALQMIAASPNVVSESHLSVGNGTSGVCVAGIPESNVTKKSLRLGGYPATEAGLRQAFLGGFAQAVVEVGGENILVDGTEGFAHWGRAGDRAMVSFPVNAPACLLACATARDAEGAFIVDALASDGGGLPRNYLIAGGLALVRFGALSLQDWVRKISVVPAGMFGLVRKGHLGEGADADVTVVDLQTATPVLSMARGQLVMINGIVVGRGGTFLTTEQGRAAVGQAGFEADVVRLEETLLYRDRRERAGMSSRDGGTGPAVRKETGQ
jgi:cytosine/adenosine deaminase-related metal-dependent hydrolase